MIPTWAAIVVGVAAGLLSGTIGTLLTIAHDRGAELRTRRLDAASAFLDTANSVRRAIRLPEEDVPSRADLADRRWDDLVQRVFLVELLFGRDSVPAKFARSTSGALRGLVEATREYDTADDVETRSAAWTEATEAIEDAILNLNVFTSASSDAAWDRWWRRHVRQRELTDYMPADWRSREERVEPDQELAPPD